MKIFLYLVDTSRILDKRFRGGPYDSLKISVDHFLCGMRKIASVQYFFVLTRCPVMKQLSQDQKYEISPCEIPSQVTRLSEMTPQDWHQITSDSLQPAFQRGGDLEIFLDTQCLMMTPKTIETMCDAILEDEQSHVVYPVYAVDPHIYMGFRGTESFYPLWEYPGLDRQKYPALYRRAEAFVYHSQRPKYKQPLKELAFPVPWYEGKSCGTNDELMAFAEYMLKRRKMMAQ